VKLVKKCGPVLLKVVLVMTFCAISGKPLAQSELIAERELLREKGSKHLFSLRLDNDMFNQKDHYYTHGLRLRVASLSQANGLVRWLLPSIGPEEDHVIGFSFDHRMYTPIKAFVENGVYGDRPYAAYWLAAMDRSSVSKNGRTQLISNFGLGLIGESAKGHQVQKTIHDWLGNKTPVEWSTQIANDVLIDYSLALSQRFMWKGPLIASANASVNVGSLYARAGLGPNFQFTGLSLGTLFDHEHSVSFGANHLVDFVQYNATLQGGAFSESHYAIASSEVERIVHRTELSLLYRYANYGVEATQVFLSREFRNGTRHSWGGLKIFMTF